MAIKENKQSYDTINDNPIVSSLYNYGHNSGDLNPPPGSSFMITEITEDFMEMELSTDLMITEN